MSRSKAVREARVKLFRSKLSMQLDEDGQLMIKCHPMFDRELRKVLREIKADARHIVRLRHSGGGKIGDPRTGNLRRSIQTGPVRRVHPTRISGTVTAGSRLAPYARFVHEGTKPGVRTVKRPGAYFRFLWQHRTGNVRVPYLGEGVDEDLLKRTGQLRVIPLVYKQGRRKGQRKVYYEWEKGDLRDKNVLVKSINHPGYKGDPFLNNAAVGVLRRYGGTIKRRDGSIIPRGG